MRATDLPNPNSAIDASRLNDGRIALIHNPTATGRGVLSLSLSSDGGETWTRAIDIENEPEAEHSYPALIQDARGRLHVTYSWRKQNIGHAVIELKN
jgi:predicted neuraminidase